MRSIRPALLGMLSLSLAGAAQADPLRVYAAGSLTGAMTTMIAAAGLPQTPVPTYGPAGLLRQRLESGEKAGLFASADLAQPQALADAGKALPPVPFARNRMCIAARPALGITEANMLDRLLDANTRLATSTPGADPGGDYAQAVFARADAVHPGAGRILTDKALRLLGAPNAMVPVAGHTPTGSIFLADRADAVLYYCSGNAALLAEVPGLVTLTLPPSLDVPVVYGLTVLGGERDAMQLALFMLSAKGQAILTSAGLLPIAAP